MKPNLPKPFYQDDYATIYHGDCRAILPVIQSVDHVITDPPYSEHVHSKARRGGAGAPARTGQGRVCRASFARVKELGFRSLTPNLMRFCAGEFSRLSRRWVLVFSDVESSAAWRIALTKRGLDYVRTGAWIKEGATPQFTGDRPAAGFEAITIAHPRGRKKWNGGGRHGLWSFPIVLNRGGQNPRLHTTQKPAELMTALIADFTDIGDTIADPFMGSGTTLLAAKQLGRKAIGIDNSRTNCENAAKRLQQEYLPLTIEPPTKAPTEQELFGPAVK